MSRCTGRSGVQLGWNRPHPYTGDPFRFVEGSKRLPAVYGAWEAAWGAFWLRLFGVSRIPNAGSDGPLLGWEGRMGGRRRGLLATLAVHDSAWLGVAPAAGEERTARAYGALTLESHAWGHPLLASVGGVGGVMARSCGKTGRPSSGGGGREGPGRASSSCGWAPASLPWRTGLTRTGPTVRGPDCG